MIETSIFCEKYDLSYINVVNATTTGRIKQFKKVGYTTYIDDKYIVRANRFKQKVMMFNQDMYHYLTEHITTTDMLRIMFPDISDGSIKVLIAWVSQRLFMVDENSFIDYRVSKTHWKFFKAGRRVIRIISRYLGYKVDIEKVLDRRMG